MEPTTRNLRGQYTARQELYTGPKPSWEIRGINVGPYPNKHRGIGSLDAATIMGQNKWKSPLALYYELRGEIPKPPSAAFRDDLAMFGALMEPVLAEFYRIRTGRTLIDRAEYVERNGTTQRFDVRRHKVKEWMVANIDVEIEKPSGDALPLPWSVNTNGVGELKTTDPWVDYFDENNEPSLSVQIQLQHQLAVADMEWGSLAVLIGRRFYHTDVARSDKFIEYLIQEEERFLERCFAGEPPPIDASDATTEALGKKFPKHEETRVVELSPTLSAKVAERYDLLVLAQKEAEEEETKLKNLIKLEMGDAAEACTKDGAMWFSWRKGQGSEAKYTVRGKRSLQDEAVLFRMGAEYSPETEGTRTFRRAKGPKKKGR